MYTVEAVGNQISLQWFVIIHNAPFISGGGCAFCGSVEHFKKDCPENSAKSKEASKTPLEWHFICSIYFW